ncbi:MAG: Ig-like domain-containing protein, partial [Betaproteobacteria bacterium]
EFVTYEDKVEEITLPPLPQPAPVIPAPTASVTPPPVAAVTPAPVEWRREVIEKEPTWVRRALRQSLPHKQTVDVYRQREQATTTTAGEKRYINRPPVAANDNFTVPFNSTGNLFDVLANDSDPDGDALAITAVGAPAHGSATIAADKVVYTPVTGFIGVDSFSYSISDGKGGSASATVTVTIQGPANRPPVAQNDTYVLDQNSINNSLNVLANDSDPDGDTLVISSVGAAAHGAATIAGNRISYTPTAGYTGADAFTYTIADGKGGNASATVTLTIQPQTVNRPPVAVNDAFTVDQNSTANSLNVLANDSDPDADPLTITSVTAPAHGTATISGNRVNYTPTTGYVGPDSFSYTISDGKGGSATATVSITIAVPAPLNRPPVAVNDAYTVDQNSVANSLNVLSNDSDPDGDALSITAVGSPAHGTATISGNRVLYTPSAGYSGADSFSYTIADGRGGTATATVSITVVTANRPPVARDDRFLISDQFTDLDVLANDSDPDGDALTIVAVTQPPFGLVEINAGGKSVRYTKPFVFNQTSFTYTISDGRGGTSTATVLLIDP